MAGLSDSYYKIKRYESNFEKTFCQDCCTKNNTMDPCVRDAMIMQLVSGGVNLLFNSLNMVDWNAGKNNVVNEEKSEKNVKSETIVEPEVKKVNSETKVADSEETLKTVLGENVYNSLSVELKTKVLSKYETLKSVLKLTDEQLGPRLNNYIKALQSHEKELQMGEYLENALKTEENEGLDNCTIKIHDEEILNQKKNGSDEEFIQSLFDRGQGYVDLYDKNSDEKVDLEEFISLEEKDSGQLLTEEEKQETEKYFNRIAGVDKKIDAKEFASHLSAVARMFDTKGKPSSIEDISYKEWFAAQMVGADENITKNYEFYRKNYDEYLGISDGN